MKSDDNLGVPISASRLREMSRKSRDLIARIYEQHVREQAAKFRRRPKLPPEDSRFDEELFR